jgi:hypothetical protein
MIIADPAPHRSAPFWPALARQHTRSARLARDRTANPVERPAICSLAPARTTRIRAKAIQSPRSAQLLQHSRRRQIPIAPVALSVPHIPRFRALAFRTPAVRAWGSSRHASIRKTCTTAASGRRRLCGSQSLNSARVIKCVNERMSDENLLCTCDHCSTAAHSDARSCRHHLPNPAVVSCVR